MIAVGDVSLALAMAGFTAVAVVFDLGFMVVVGAVASGYVLQALAMGLAAVRSGGMAIGASRRTWSVLTRLALPLGGALILNYLYFRLDILLLSWMKGEEEVGLYGLGYRVIEALIVLPGFLMLALFPRSPEARTIPRGSPRSSARRWRRWRPSLFRWWS